MKNTFLTIGLWFTVLITLAQSARPSVSVKTIGVFVYDGFNTLDAIGPYQVLSYISGVDIFFVAKERGVVRNQRGLKVQVDKSFADVSKLDMLVIPGGAKETFMQTQDTTVLNWIRRVDQTTVFTTSVCTGGWILGATGLLKGREVSCNWYRASEIMQMYGATYRPERFVRDDKYWTSAGVTAGMDMALAIVNEIMGEAYTRAVLLDLEYDPKPIYEAGSTAKSDKATVEMMTRLYDAGLLQLIEQAKQRQKP